MNWLRTLWNWLTTPDTDDRRSVTPVEAEEEVHSAGSIFATLCRAAGVKKRDLDSTNAEALFDEWYTGDVVEEDIRKSVAEFKEAHPKVNAKLAGRL